METNKLIAVFLPILAIVTVLIVIQFTMNKKVTRAQKRTALSMMIVGIILLIISAVTLL